MTKGRSSTSGPVHVGSSFNLDTSSKSDLYSVLFKHVETLDSMSHPNWRKSGDGGGVFVKTSEYLLKGTTAPFRAANASNLRYRGSFACKGSISVSPLIGDGKAWGAIAYDRMKPTKPLLSLANMVYELRDLGHAVRQVQTGFKRSLSGIADNFLSQVFGWMPLVGDVMAVIESQQSLQSRVEWLLRNEGKWIKRKTILRDSFTQTVGDWSSDWSAFDQSQVTQMYHGTPESKVRTWTKDRIWATAEFRYFLPDPPPGVKVSMELIRATSGLHNIRLHQLYRMIPWSWMVDWCFGLARLLENADAGVANSLAARRFYIMREQEVGSIWDARATMRPEGNRNARQGISATTITYKSRKTRVHGAPFYPGNPEELSGLQLAILGALGFSRYG